MNSATRLALAAAVAAAVAGPARKAAAQVTTAQYGNARRNLTRDTLLTPRAVGPGGFGKVARLLVDGDVYAQPLYLPRVAVPGHGTRAVLFVATEHNSVYAFDAKGTNGTPLWRVSLMDSSRGRPVPFRDLQCPFIRPEVGITATPVIDTSSGVLYALARTQETGPAGSPRYVQRLFAIDVRTGKERLPPVEIRAAVPGTGAGSRHGIVDFNPLRQNPRAALLLSHGVVYLSWASSCDVGPYHGWIMAYDARTLRQLGTFNTSPDGDEAGVWQADAGLAADSAGLVYAVTGNGSFDTTGTRRDYGSTVLKLALTPRGLEVRDYFTPFDEAALTGADADLGSSGPILLPGIRGHRHLLLVTGKAGLTYLVDRDAMGHFQAGSNTHAVQTLQTSDGGFAAPAYWNGTVYLWGSNAPLEAYRLQDARLDIDPLRSGARTGDPGAVPVVSTSGGASGIVWAVTTRSWRGADRPAVLYAFDASDIRRELFNSEMRAGRDRAGIALRFSIPTVADGRVFVGAKGEVDVYGLLPAPSPRVP